MCLSIVGHACFVYCVLVFFVCVMHAEQDGGGVVQGAVGTATQAHCPLLPQADRPHQVRRKRETERESRKEKGGRE